MSGGHQRRHIGTATHWAADFTLHKTRCYTWVYVTDLTYPLLSYDDYLQRFMSGCKMRCNSSALLKLKWSCAGVHFFFAYPHTGHFEQVPQLPLSLLLQTHQDLLTLHHPLDDALHLRQKLHHTLAAHRCFTEWYTQKWKFQTASLAFFGGPGPEASPPTDHLPPQALNHSWMTLRHYYPQTGWPVCFKEFFHYSEVVTLYASLQILVCL